MISYEPLYKTLKEKNVSTYKLINNYGISRSLLDRLKHNRPISTVTLNDLCTILHCRVEDILVFTSPVNSKTFMHRVIYINQNEKLIFTARLLTDRNKTAEEYTADLLGILDSHSVRGEEFEGAVISSVVPEISDALSLAVKNIIGKDLISDK